MSTHGVLLVDKPSGCTSHDVVGRLRRLLQMKSIGHAGTLDPLASGLLVILLGEATKLSDYLLTQDKNYRVKVKLGVETDSLDMDGTILRQQEVNLDPELIRSEASQLVGELSLKVPKFSAVKVKGKKLYESAHKGEEVQVPTRTMEFYDVNFEEVTSSSTTLSLSCEKGGYIRSWAAALGEKLEVGGAVEELRRLGSVPYHIEDAISLEELEEKLAGDSKLEDLGIPAFVPINDCLSDWKTVTVSGRDEQLMTNGQVPLDLSRRLLPEVKSATRLQRPIGIKVIGASQRSLLSLVEAQPNKGLKVKRVFNL